MYSNDSRKFARSTFLALSARIFLVAAFGFGFFLNWQSAVAATLQTNLFTAPKIEPQKTLGSLQIDDAAIDETLESISGESVLPSRSTVSGARLGSPRLGGNQISQTQIGETGLSPAELRGGPYGPVPNKRQPPVDGRTMFREPPDTETEGVLNQNMPLQYRGETIFPNDIFAGQTEQRPQSSRRVTMPDANRNRTPQNAGARYTTPAIDDDRLEKINRQSRSYSEATHDIITERYPDGNIKIVRTITQDREGNYQNDGGWMMYNRQQQLIASGNFAMGVKQGKWERIHEVGSGGIFSELPFNLFRGPYKSAATFVDGQIDGTWTLSDQAGKVMCVISYKEGVRDGVAIWNYPNGRKMREATFENGVPDGYVRQWDDRGEIQLQQRYVDGRRILRKKSTHSNQTVASERVFRDRKLVLQGRDDWWAAKPATYVPAGEPVQHGSVSEWFPNRQPKMSGQYANGLREGRFTWWHASRNKKAEGEFREGMRQGLWRYWHESGMKRSEGEFRDDEPFGVWRIWDQNGQLLESKTFPEESSTIDSESGYQPEVNLTGVSDGENEADAESILSPEFSDDNIESLKVDVDEPSEEESSQAILEDQPSDEIDIDWKDDSSAEDSKTDSLESIPAEAVEAEKAVESNDEIAEPGSIRRN